VIPQYAGLLLSTPIGTDDVDLAVKNGLGLKWSRPYPPLRGIPVWSSGIMSEKATGVGISGYRLGIFLRTAPVAANTTRLIIEHGVITHKTWCYPPKPEPSSKK
jgi:hypothetical protein